MVYLTSEILDNSDSEFTFNLKDKLQGDDWTKYFDTNMPVQEFHSKKAKGRVSDG